MEMKIPAIAITAVVVVIVLAGVLMPVLDDATAQEDTFKNKGYFYVDVFTDTYTFKWNYTNPEVFEINGETVEYTANTGSDPVSVFLTDACAMRYTNSTLVCSFYGGGTYISGNSTYPEMTATLSSGTLTVTNGTTTKAITSVTEIYSIVTDGPFVMKDKNEIAYLNADSEIYASGQTFSGSAYIFCHFSGTIDNLSFGPDTLTYSDVVVSSTENKNHEDLYELSKISFTATNQSSVEFKPVYSYFVVPAEVTAERTVHFTDNENAIFAAIPIMVIVALLIAVVALVFRGRQF